MNLISENERLQNDLNSKRKINERMMKSQVDIKNLTRRVIIDRKENQELDIKKKLNHPNKEVKRIKDPLTFIGVS